MLRISQIILTAKLVSIALVSPGQDSSSFKLCNETHKITERLNALSSKDVFSIARAKIEKAAIDKNEHGLMFGIDSFGTVISSNVMSDRAKNSSPVNIHFPGAFADMHNHPGNTAPSAGDIYNLIKLNNEYPSFDTRFAVLANGTVYAIVITDRQKASSFLKRYPPEQTPGFSPRFPEKLFNEFADIKSFLINIQDVDRTKADEIATAFMLDKYDSGVTLFLHRSPAIFTRIIAKEIVRGNGSKFYQVELCSE